jgi:hypothetical protein
MSSTLQEPTTDAVYVRSEALRKITASQSFVKAPRLCSFLAYVVEKSIEGDVDSLTEQQIGINVFHRSPGYNTNDDNIVRGTARALRQRLETYYLTEGQNDAIRIEIAKGAYVAQFHEDLAMPEFSLREMEDTPIELRSHGLVNIPQPVVASSSYRWQSLSGWVVALVFAAFALWPAVHGHWVRTHSQGAPLWNTLFTHDRPTLIVPGDAGLNMYEGLEKHTVGLNAYSQENYKTDPGANSSLADSLGFRFYTTLSDLQLVSRLVRLPQASESERVLVRFARDLTPSDIKDANLILMGTSSYNPWVELFQSGPTLKMQWDVNQDLFTVYNLAPGAGEQREYHWTVKNGTQGGLTLISLTDNTQGSGRVLLIEGATMGGVFAGGDFLQNKQLLGPILAKAQRPDGSVKNFDVLLQSDFIREGVSNLHVLAAHVR